MENQKTKGKEVIIIKNGSKCTFRTSGITLIALVVTIVILLILAGITINLVLADGGIFNKAEESKEAHEKGEAREKLELALADLQIDKHTESEYNENEYIDNRLAEGEMIATGDMVIVNEYQFLIDRTVPKIIDELGKGEFNESIQITANIGYTDYTNATITVEIAYEEEIDTVTIDGIEATKTEDGKYTRTVNANKTYTIIAKDTEGKLQIETLKVEEISEDLDIYTAEQLANFRNRVNNGATYEGRTIRVMADIDLNPGKYIAVEDGTKEFTADAQTWEPIGTETNPFLGTFDGNKHKIQNIYINNSLDYQGLFSYNGGTIRNILLDEGNITGSNYIGGICGYNLENGIIEKCSNNVTITATNRFAHGINGQNLGTIQECCNYANITSISATAGGIGLQEYGGTTKYCYNLGDLCTGQNDSSNAYAGGICGGNNGTISFSYNMGNITLTKGKNYLGGVVGITEKGNLYDSYSSTMTKVIGRNYPGSGVTSNASIKTEEEIRAKSFIDLIGGSEYWKFDEESQMVILKWQ